ncbi:DUF134 domain-containing protein, partial [Candidatus Woesearchaeota archaeon]|nr:DUF134 domain-containing protein [Candidatus Woesearchaeota archaeon]
MSRVPRRRHCRWVNALPKINYFKPAGIRMPDLEEVNLRVEEFEALRLKDLLGLEQEAAAKKMNISQPTFHRLVTEARKKVADAIVHGKAIRIEGGDFKMIRRGRGFGFGGPPSQCVCPNCGYKEQKVRGVPCVSKKCPK